MRTIDFTIASNETPLTEEQAERSAELQAEHVNGNCHALTVLLACHFPDAQPMALSAPDAGVFHSFVRVKGQGVDGWGVGSTPVEIIEEYATNLESTEAVSVDGVSCSRLVELAGLEPEDIELAFEFWRLMEMEYALPEQWRLPKGATDLVIKKHGLR